MYQKSYPPVAQDCHTVKLALHQVNHQCWLCKRWASALPVVLAVHDELLQRVAERLSMCATLGVCH